MKTNQNALSLSSTVASTRIRARLLESGDRFFANDKIAQHIQAGELQELEDELTSRFEGVLYSLVIDSKDPNSADTPRRLAKMYLHEIMRGRYYPQPNVTGFPNEGKGGLHYTGVQVTPAEIISLCSHHHQTVRGVAYIGVLPGKQLLGLSKFSRLARDLAERGTLQEELTLDIANLVSKESGTPDVAVQILATHGCCENRGIKANNSLAATQIMLGTFMDSATLRAEFFSTINLIRSGRP